MIIRPFRDSDEDAVVRLWRECFPVDPPWNDARRVVQRKREVQRELFLVGLVNDEVVCSAIAGYDGFRGWVYHVATAAAHRRHGLARQMMGQVERRLAQAGCPKLNLQVRSTNAEVLAFYKALGYKVEDRVSFGKLLDADAQERDR